VPGTRAKGRYFQPQKNRGLTPVQWLGKAVIIVSGES